MGGLYITYHPLWEPETTIGTQVGRCFLLFDWKSCKELTETLSEETAQIVTRWATSYEWIACFFSTP